MMLTLEDIRYYIQKNDIKDKIDYNKPYIKCLGILNIENAEKHEKFSSIDYLMLREHEMRCRGSRLGKIIVTIKGPEKSFYEKGVFRVSIEFPDNYPDGRPKIKFLNKIAHIQCHEDSGHICVEFINYWNKNTSLIEILVGLYLFFIYDQNMYSPYNSSYREIYCKYEESKMKFKEYAEKYIDNYAKPSGPDLELIRRMEQDN